MEPNKIFISILLILILTGGSQKYEIFGYKTCEKDLKWGSVGAKLIGSKVENDKKIIRQSPYELFLWFDSKTKTSKAINLLEIKLKYFKSGKIAFKNLSNLTKQFKHENEEYAVYFSFQDIKLNYDDLELNIKYEVHEAGHSIEYNTNLVLEKNYQKYKMIISH